jgi:hypothetical protein
MDGPSAIFHLRDEPVPALADPFPNDDPLPGAYELHLPSDGVTIWYTVTPLTDLLVPPGNRLEKLTGDRGGQYSIRINQQWRICFRWSDAGPEDVEIVDYH